MVLWVIAITIIIIGLINTDLSSILGLSTRKVAPLVIFPTPAIQELSPTPDYVQPTLAPKVYVPVPTTDPDPVIECQNPNCGSINIKKSLCSNTVGYACCQVGNTWTWYASRSRCSQDQANYQNNQRNNNQGTQQLQIQQQNLQNYVDSVKYNACIFNANTKLSICKSPCNKTYEQNKYICSFAYGTGSTNGYNDEKFAECLSEISDETNQCLNACSNNYTSDLLVCAP